MSLTRRTPMRRTPMPARTTPLKAKTAPKGSSGTGQRRAVPLAAGKPLQRRSRIARATEPIRRTTPLRPVSPKHAAKMRRRRAVIQAAYPRRPLCSVPWCPSMADDIHEPLTRGRGGAIDDAENMTPLCRPCHDVITFTEPAWAYSIGLLVHSWGGAA